MTIQWIIERGEIPREELKKKLIVNEQVRAFTEKLMSIPTAYKLKLVGSALDESGCRHDIDYELQAPESDTKPCKECQEFAKKVESLVPPIAVDIFCKACGGWIKFRERPGWIYQWTPTDAKFILEWESEMRKLTPRNFFELSKRVRQLEKRIEALEWRLSHQE